MFGRINFLNNSIIMQYQIHNISKCSVIFSNILYLSNWMLNKGSCLTLGFLEIFGRKGFPTVRVKIVSQFSYVLKDVKENGDNLN